MWSCLPLNPVFSPKTDCLIESPKSKLATFWLPNKVYFPDIPRCESNTSWPSVSINKYFARLLTATIVDPSRREIRSFGKGYRRFFRRNMTLEICLPTHAFSKPLRTVSTSGSSGMFYSRRRATKRTWLSS